MPFSFRRDSDTRPSQKSCQIAPCFLRSIRTPTFRPGRRWLRLLGRPRGRAPVCRRDRRHGDDFREDDVGDVFFPHALLSGLYARPLAGLNRPTAGSTNTSAITRSREISDGPLIEVLTWWATLGRDPLSAVPLGDHRRRSRRGTPPPRHLWTSLHRCHRSHYLSQGRAYG